MSDFEFVRAVARTFNAKVLSPKCQKKGCHELGYDRYFFGQRKRYCHRHWLTLFKLRQAQRIDRKGLADWYTRLFGKGLPAGSQVVDTK